MSYTVLGAFIHLLAAAFMPAAAHFATALLCSAGGGAEVPVQGVAA